MQRCNNNFVSGAQNKIIRRSPSSRSCCCASWRSASYCITSNELAHQKSVLVRIQILCCISDSVYRNENLPIQEAKRSHLPEVLGVGALLGHVASLAEALEARVAVSLDAVLYNRHQHVKLVQ